MDKHFFSEAKEFLGFSKVGFEKESLRIANSRISKSSHPELLGSALCNKFITTDFSESQLELVTPPFKNNNRSLAFLEDIHHFVSCNLKDEFLWPFSMPTNIDNEKDINISNYGTSNLGLFKRIYRNGLSHRYGRMMQTISGVHYNYSFSDRFWQKLPLKNLDKDYKEIRSLSYFNMLRNISRVNWLILYLFGASPIITRNLLTKEKQSFQKLDDETYYLKYATSLRMSNFGYYNILGDEFSVSLDSLASYISDIQEATKTPSKSFKSLNKKNNKNNQQINENLLQIDDEFYAVARAKSRVISNQRTTSKLTNGGVDFIELRSLDLNPYSRIGIDQETTNFLEILLSYCFVKQKGYLSDLEKQEISHNDSLVAKQGRYPGLYLQKDGEKIRLKDLGNQILDELYPIATLLDNKQNQYTKSLDLMVEKINDPSKTISGRLMDDIFTKNISFIELGATIGEANKDYYINLDQSQNSNWDFLKEEVKSSLNQQHSLEKNERESFEDFLDSYFKT